MNAKPALILLGHGSRTSKTSEEMGELAAKMQSSVSGLAVSSAFLTLLDPDLPRAIDKAVYDGADEIHILPLFFFSGKHVLEDIPALFKEAKARHPGVKMELRDPIGHHPEFFGFLLQAGGFA
jgi:sirohydrochlorin ferrochelatase